MTPTRGDGGKRDQEAWAKHDFLARWEARRKANPKHPPLEIAMGISKDLYRAIIRGGLDIAPCRKCSADVVCIPDGLCMCDDCAAKERN